MQRIMTWSIAAAAGMTLAGCASFNVHKGAVIDQQLAASIQPGVDNKDSVQKLLGTPTLAGQFTSTDWYYVSRDQTQLAFRDPRVTRQKVLHVKFDAAGNVVSIGQTGKDLAMNLSPSGRKTPSLGRKRGLFDELFGNIGSVNSGGMTPGPDQ
jgi:outer membrane protein assembly factor BamE (lipoprotein component of BamABCDE complex)